MTRRSQGITEKLACYVADLGAADLPSDVTTRAKHLTIDLVGSIVRAGQEESTASVIAALNRLQLDGPGKATVFGQSRRYNPPVAALLNGALGHSLDFDDTHADSSLHPSAPVVPAALASAEMTGASGQNLLAAIVVGFEVCCRLGSALDPASHYARGFHPTATAGTFGAAAAAGKLLGLDAAGMISAFSIALSQAAGSLQFLANGAWNKRYQVGAAAMNGLIAATLAREGFRGATEAIEGKHGLLAGYTDNPRAEKATAGLGTVFETLRIGVKPYPSCRYTHAAIDGLLDLRRAEGWSADDIASVRIGLHANGILLTGAPLNAKQRPRNIVDCQFSMPFTAAIALTKGSFGWDDYALIGNQQVQALAGRISVERDRRVEGLAHPFGATLHITARTGTFERIIRTPPGEPELFPDRSQIDAKFLTLAKPVLGDGAQRLLHALHEIDVAPDVTGIALRQ